ncbi:MAG: 30S ribosomal protein S17 [Patescibacteria group bacterium]|nr:30S ribosomal protein S17 [Patescibacteria group bacterium]
MKARKLIGVVVSDRMDKTRVVAVERLIKHARYQKFFKDTKRYKVHDEQNMFHVGDTVSIQETRPLSREKRWKIVELIKKGTDQKEAEDKTITDTE